jgi:hypothetical protein
MTCRCATTDSSGRHADALVWGDESKLELACRFIDEQGSLDEFNDFLGEQAEGEADDGE